MYRENKTDKNILVISGDLAFTNIIKGGVAYVSRRNSFSCTCTGF